MIIFYKQMAFHCHDSRVCILANGRKELDS